MEEKCQLAYVGKVEQLHPLEGAGRPLPKLTELPSCAVCLERMDESVRTVLTVLCNHSFHSSCLKKWEDLTCPVCRYTQVPSSEDEQTNRYSNMIYIYEQISYGLLDAQYVAQTKIFGFVSFVVMLVVVVIHPNMPKNII